MKRYTYVQCECDINQLAQTLNDYTEQGYRFVTFVGEAWNTEGAGGIRQMFLIEKEIQL